MSKDNARNIGYIGNYYGGLAIKEEDGKFYWSIENWGGHDWDECPEYLFKALTQHQDELESSDKARGTTHG